MEVILYDLTTSLGHHSIYFNRILSICTERGYKVYTLFEDPAKIKYKDHPQVQVLNSGDFRDFLSRLVLKVASFPLLKGISSLADILMIRKIIAKKKLKDAIVLFPYMDSVLPIIPYKLGQFLINFQFTGIYMLPVSNSDDYFHDQLSERLNKEYYLKKACSCLFLHNSYAKSFTNTLKRDRFYTLPELLYLERSNDLAPEIKTAANGRVIIGIIGSLVRKKNFLRFLETAARLDDGYYFLIMGIWPKATYSSSEIDQMAAYLKEIKGYSWQETDHYIATEELYNELMNVCDIVWLHHPRHPFSSNSLIKAMAMQKPVLVAPGYIMEEVVKSYKWSDVAEDKVDSIIRTVRYIQETFKVPIKEHRRLMEDHAPEKFEGQVLKAIAACE